MDKLELTTDMQNLYGGIAELIKQAKTRVAVAVNAELTVLYWNVGNSVNKYVLDSNCASYGKQIIANLSHLLTADFGKGWGEKHIRHCLRVAETIEEEQIVYALRRQLSWTHVRTIAYENDPLKRQFYFPQNPKS